MTGALTIYSATFMRYALAVQPKNYLLFACHFINTGSQLTQGYRWMQYHKWGGKEKELKLQAEGGFKEVVGKVEGEAKALVDKAVGKNELLLGRRDMMVAEWIEWEVRMSVKESTNVH